MLELSIYIYSVCLFIGCLIVALYLWKSNSGFAKGLILPSLDLLLAGISLMMLFQLDSLVHGSFYNYGLQYSDVWANEYWLLQRSVMGFNSIIIAVSLAMIVKERITLSKSLSSEEETPSTEEASEPKKSKQKPKSKPSKKHRKPTAEPPRTMEEMLENGEEVG